MMEKLKRTTAESIHKLTVVIKWMSCDIKLYMLQGSGGHFKYMLDFFLSGNSSALTKNIMEVIQTYKE